MNTLEERIAELEQANKAANAIIGQMADEATDMFQKGYRKAMAEASQIIELTNIPSVVKTRMLAELSVKFQLQFPK
jgi:hypothetical protein